MRLSIKKKHNISQILQLGLLFFVSLNFANAYFYMIFLTFLICAITNVREFKFDTLSIVFALISLCYILFNSFERHSLTTILKQLAYPMCYLVGLNLFYTDNDTDQIGNSADNLIKLSIIVVAMGTLLHYLLNAVANIGSLSRNTADFWTGEVISATHQALLAIIAIGVFSVWIINPDSWQKRALSLAGLILVFGYNFVLAGRTIILLSAITICIAFLYNQRYTNMRTLVKSYLFPCVIILGVLVLFINNVWGLRDWILSSNLSNRFETQDALMDIRFERKLLYISRMLEFPFGGGHLRTAVGGYAHDLYLDVFNDVGIIGYVLVIASSVMSAINALRVIKSHKVSIETRCMTLCVFIGINAIFFLEPILQGEPWFFCLFCFLSGIIKNSLLLKQQVE